MLAATGRSTTKLQRLLDLAAGQGGYFTAAQAHGLGYSSRSLQHHVGTGRLERVSRGFYRLAALPTDAHEDVLATWLRFAHRGAVVSHETALGLYDLAPSRSRAIHLTVPRAQRPRNPAAPGVELHTTTRPLRRDEVARRFGVDVTSPARTISDAATIGVDPGVVVEATARAMATGLVTRDELCEAASGRSARVRRLVERAIREAGAGA